MSKRGDSMRTMRGYLVAVSLLLAAPGVEPGYAQEKKSDPSGKPAQGTAPGQEKRRAGPPPLPAEKLPPRTAAPPDPAKEQYRRDPVHVSIKERIQPREAPAYEPPAEARVLENHIAEYFRRAGFAVVRDPAGARYTIEGSFECKFHEAIVFQGQTIAHKYVGSATVSVKGKDGGEPLDRVEVPEYYADGILRPGVPEERRAAMEMRRRLAKVLWERLFHMGKTLADAEIPGLLARLAADDPEEEAPVLARDVVKALAAKRFTAVPYLLDALTDDRVVRVHATYPGLTSANSNQLRIYHLADKALEEIFQKVSRMGLESTQEDRFAVIRGWEGEWSRYCPSYRDSPQRALAAKKQEESR